jgi:hypothetical protein
VSRRKDPGRCPDCGRAYPVCFGVPTEPTCIARHGCAEIAIRRERERVLGIVRHVGGLHVDSYRNRLDVSQAIGRALTEIMDTIERGET